MVVRQFSALAFLLLIASKSFGDWPPGAPDPPPQFDPRLITALPSELDQGMDSTPAGLRLLADAVYSFGTTVSPAGDVYFTEFGNQRIRRYNIADGSLSTVVTNRPAVYGITSDSEGNIFYAQDSDTGTGRIVKRTPAGVEQTIYSGLTRPRQLTTDSVGNVYAVLETRAILKWNKSNGNVQFLVTSPQFPAGSPPQGVAVANDGRVFFSTYSETGAHGVAFQPGAVWVRNTNGSIAQVASGFWRARGLTMHPNGKLYLITEANVWDQGNSGLLVEVDPATNMASPVLSGIDYAQFPAVGPDGRIYVTQARDNKLVSFDPAHSFTPQTIAESDLRLIAENAIWHETNPGNARPIGLEIGGTVSIDGFLDLEQGASDASLWLNLPASRFPGLAPVPNPNSVPGVFETPSVAVTWSMGDTSAFAIPLREHVGSRWPMTNVGTPNESPYPGFRENPEAYLVYVNVKTGDGVSANRWIGSGEWNVASEWSSGAVPNGTSGETWIEPLSISSANSFPTVSTAGNVVQNLVVGDNGEGIGLRVLGGSLHATGSINLGTQYAATIDLVAGTLSADGDINLSTLNGQGSGTINVSGGLLQTDAQLLLGWNEHAGTLNISGGAVQVDGILIFNLDGGNLEAQEARVNLSGGTLTANGLSINTLDPAMLNIAGGEFILPVSNLDNVNYWIGSGNITAYDGAGTLLIDTTTLPGSLIVSAELAGLQGDYNGDGTVDAADYTVWRNALGTSDLSADGNHDGVVDSLDYGIWKDHYGETAPGAGGITVVPELSSVRLLLAFVLGYLGSVAPRSHAVRCPNRGA